MSGLQTAYAYWRAITQRDDPEPARMVSEGAPPLGASGIFLAALWCVRCEVHMVRRVDEMCPSCAELELVDRLADGGAA